jgi:pyrroloquinoline quinone biosynthesis protein D
MPIVHIITEQSRPALASGTRLSIDRRTGEPVFLYPEGVVELSPTAHAILSHCNGEVTIGEIIAALAAEFESDCQPIREDVIDCLSRLRQRNLIVVT